MDRVPAERSVEKYMQFDAQAKSMADNWLALRRDHASLVDDFNALRADHGVAIARIEELSRANAQKEMELLASMTREGEAMKRVGFLEAQMHTAASSFHAAVYKPPTREDQEHILNNNPHSNLT